MAAFLPFLMCVLVGSPLVALAVWLMERSAVQSFPAWDASSDQNTAAVLETSMAVAAGIHAGWADSTAGDSSSAGAECF